MRAYLDAKRDASIVLVGEAAGYRGARVSGIAFTSERQLTGAGPSEASATIEAAPAFAADALQSSYEEIVTLAPGESVQRSFSQPGTVYVSDADDPSIAAVIDVTTAPQVSLLAFDISARIDQNHSVTLDLADLGAYSADQRPLSFDLVVGPAHGTTDLVSGTLTYTPDSDYIGDEALRFFTEPKNVCIKFPAE